MKLPIAHAVAFSFLLAQARAEGNDLNKVVSHILGEMTAAGFFSQALEEYYTIQGSALEPCNIGDMVSPDAADESLTSVLENKKVRIALSTAGANVPAYYSDGDDPFDLATGTLVGYEIAAQQEAFTMMGTMYNLSAPIEIEYVLVEPNSDGVFFEPLLEALESGTADIAWTTVAMNSDRAALVDFTTCPTYKDEMVVGVGSGLGADIPTEGGPFPVACVAVFCTATVPETLTLQELEPGNGLQELLEVLVNEDDGIDYTLGNKAPLTLYINDNCPDTCSIASVDLDFVIVQSPITKKLVEAGTDGGDGMDGSDGMDGGDGTDGGVGTDGGDGTEGGDATNVEDSATTFAGTLVGTALASSLLVAFLSL